MYEIWLKLNSLPKKSHILEIDFMIKVPVLVVLEILLEL